MITPPFARTFGTLANQLPIVRGRVTALRRSAQRDAQTIVELEGALDRAVRLRHRLQPTSKGGA